MAWMQTVWREAVGLFVDDGRLAAAVVLWLGLCWLALPRLGLAPIWSAGVLSAGLVLILAETVIRRAGAPPDRRAPR